MNAHIAREAEHSNPKWVDIDLLDAGTVLQPGDMDVRLSHLCVEYQEEMTDNSWAGKPEIIALCTLLNCNCIVWELLHGYAREVFRNIQDPSSSTTKTVHLHLANKEHYEFTDIPQVHAFLHSCSILFLTTLHFSDSIPPQVPPHDYRRSSTTRRLRALSP